MDDNYKPKAVDYLCSGTPSERQEAIDYFSGEGQIYIFYLSSWTGRHSWPSVVAIINKIGKPDNYKYIPMLLDSLKDFNWPGAREAHELLKTFDNKVLMPYLEEALREAIKEYNDTDWIGSLEHLTKAKGITESDFSSPEIYKILDLADW